MFFGFHGFRLNFIMDVVFGLCHLAVNSALCCSSYSYVVIVSPMLIVLYFVFVLHCALVLQV